MATDPQDAKRSNAFASGLGFAVALAPVLAIVGLFFPDGAECAPKATDCSFLPARYFAQGTLQAVLVVLGSVALLVWLVLGLRYVYRGLTTLPRAQARNVLFFYAILTCSAFFLVLPMAVVTVLIVFVLAELVLRFAPRKTG